MPSPAQKPRFVKDPPLRRVSRGSVSHPSDVRTPAYKRLAQDATPTVVSRGTVSHPRD
jgi:hypothetical protein